MSEDLLFRPPVPPVRRSPQSRTLSDLLHELMAHNGFSQRELARAIGVSTNTVNQHLHGVRVPTEWVLRKIANYADLPITDVREMADRATGETGQFIPSYPELDQLDYPERMLLVSTGRALLRARAQKVTR